MDTRRLPLVLLIDLDGTLIGGVKLLLAEYDMHREAARLAGAETAAATAAKASRTLRESFVTRLQEGGILRPHVRRFARRMEQLCAKAGATPVELFVYTASEDSWAKFLIPCVEAAIGVRFNRPLFVRSHCVAGGARKAIAPLLPKIASALRRRYARLASSDLVDRVVLIDNTPDIMMDPSERERLIVCPTYSYRHIHDVIGRLPASIPLERPSLIATVLARNDIDLSPHVHQLARHNRPGPSDGVLAAYYHWLSTAIMQSHESNTSSIQSDVFWEAMRRLVSAVARRSVSATLPSDAVKSLRQALSERMNSDAAAR